MGESPVHLVYLKEDSSTANLMDDQVGERYFIGAEGTKQRP